MRPGSRQEGWSPGKQAGLQMLSGISVWLHYFTKLALPLIALNYIKDQSYLCRYTEDYAEK